MLCLRRVLGSGSELRAALVNAALLALWAVLPGLFLGYARLSLAARHIRPEFSLRKSEADELDRALLLYENVCCRLKDISAQDNGERGGWRALFGRGVEMGQQYADERDDLEAHAHHLRGTIARLKRRPLQRLTSWLRILNWRFALGGALAAHLAAFALLIALHASSASELSARTKSPLIWYPFDERLFYANAVAAGFAAAAAALLFLLRRANLRRTYSFELRALKEFSAADPGQAIEQLKVDGVWFERRWQRLRLLCSSRPAAFGDDRGGPRCLQAADQTEPSGSGARDVSGIQEAGRNRDQKTQCCLSARRACSDSC